MVEDAKTGVNQSIGRPRPPPGGTGRNGEAEEEEEEEERARRNKEEEAQEALREREEAAGSYQLALEDAAAIRRQTDVSLRAGEIRAARAAVEAERLALFQLELVGCAHLRDSFPLWYSVPLDPLSGYV